MNNPTPDTYVPGVCNINTHEIKQRRAAGHIGLAIFLIGLVVLVLLDVNRWFRLILIAPAILAAVGYLQAKNKFCVGYGGAGLQNAGEGSTEASQVASEDAVKDKRRARQINMQALAFGAVIGLLTLLIP